jgi:hypothetical protein
MAIRINLISEAQAEEEVRRKDPVKRGIVLGAILVFAVLVYVGSLQVKIMAEGGQLQNLQGKLSTHTNEYVHILTEKKQLEDVKTRLVALNKLAVERFLQANLLNCMAHTTVDGIQITHLSTEQYFEPVLEVKATTDRGRNIPAKPACSLERSKLIINAKDSSADPGNEQINKFRETLANSAYFQSQGITLNNILLKNLSSPQLDGETGKPYVLFSLECPYPDRAREL